MDILQGQKEDQHISRVYTAWYVNAKRRPTIEEKLREPRETRRYLREWTKLHVDNKSGILYRGEQIVLPQKYRRMVYRELHEQMGHLGTERVFTLARERFYWPGMKKNIDHFVNRVCNCYLKQKRPTFVTREPLQPITTTAPFELVSVDFVHLEHSSGRYEYILIIVDHFTRYTQAYPTWNKSANTVAEKLVNEFIPCTFWIPIEDTPRQRRRN